MVYVSNPRILWSSFPGAPLDRYVERFWVGRVSSNPNILIPGTGCDILFPLKSPLTLSSTEMISVDGAFLVNIKSGVCKLSHSHEDFFLSIRLRTGALRHFVPDGVFTDRVDLLSMKHLWGNNIVEMNKKMAKVYRFDEIVQLLSGFLLDKLQQFRKRDLWIDRANEYLYYNHSELRIEELSEDLNISRRHLERVFRSCFGVTPKAHQCLCRLQQTIRDHLISGNGLEDSALKHGYFDYSHFSKEFERILQRKVSAFDWNEMKMSHFYNYSTNPCSMLFQPS